MLERRVPKADGWSLRVFIPKTRWPKESEFTYSKGSEMKALEGIMRIGNIHFFFQILINKIIGLR